VTFPNCFPQSTHLNLKVNWAQKFWSTKSALVRISSPSAAKHADANPGGSFEAGFTSQSTKGGGSFAQNNIYSAHLSAKSPYDNLFFSLLTKLCQGCHINIEH
jgi:hypothetical protein